MGLFGKAVHLTLDATLLSVGLAGLKRASGLTPDLAQVPDGTARSLLGSYLGMGETAFDVSLAYASKSQYFTRGSTRD